MADFEIDHRDPAVPKAWESDFARQKRQAEWAKREAEAVATKRRNRWLAWVYRPVVVMGLVVGCLFATDYVGLTHLGLMKSRQDEAFPAGAPSPVAYRVQRPPAQDAGLVAAPAQATEAIPIVVNERALAQAERHLEQCKSGCAALGKERQEKWSAWDVLDQYSYGTLASPPGRAFRNPDGLNQRLKAQADLVASVSDVQASAQAIVTVREQGTILRQLQVEMENDQKELTRLQELMDSIDQRGDRLLADQQATEQRIADIQVGRGPPPETEEPPPDHPRGIIQLAK